MLQIIRRSGVLDSDGGSGILWQPGNHNNSPAVEARPICVVPTLAEYWTISRMENHDLVL